LRITRPCRKVEIGSDHRFSISDEMLIRPGREWAVPTSTIRLSLKIWTSL
jgi:hypothetical protein